LKLKLGFEQAKSTQEMQILSLVVSSALGGRKSKPKPPRNSQEAHAQIAAVFGK